MKQSPILLISEWFTITTSFDNSLHKILEWYNQNIEWLIWAGSWTLLELDKWSANYLVEASKKSLSSMIKAWFDKHKILNILEVQLDKWLIEKYDVFKEKLNQLSSWFKKECYKGNITYEQKGDVHSFVMKSENIHVDENGDESFLEYIWEYDDTQNVFSRRNKFSNLDWEEFAYQYLYNKDDHIEQNDVIKDTDTKKMELDNLSQVPFMEILDEMFSWNRDWSIIWAMSDNYSLNRMNDRWYDALPINYQTKKIPHHSILKHLRYSSVDELIKQLDIWNIPYTKVNYSQWREEVWYNKRADELDKQSILKSQTQWDNTEVDQDMIGIKLNLVWDNDEEIVIDLLHYDDNFYTDNDQSLYQISPDLGHLWNKFWLNDEWNLEIGLFWNHNWKFKDTEKSELTINTRVNVIDFSPNENGEIMFLWTKFDVSPQVLNEINSWGTYSWNLFASAWDQIHTSKKLVFEIDENLTPTLISMNNHRHNRGLIKD